MEKQAYFRISVANGNVQLSVFDSIGESLIFSEENNDIPVPYLIFGTYLESLNFSDAIRHATEKYKAIPVTREIHNGLFDFDPNDD